MNVKHCLLLLQRRSAGINRKFAASHKVLERNHRWVIIIINVCVILLLYHVHYCSHEREVDAKTKSNSLPTPQAVAYRPTSGQQPSLPALYSVYVSACVCVCVCVCVVHAWVDGWVLVYMRDCLHACVCMHECVCVCLCACMHAQ